MTNNKKARGDRLNNPGNIRLSKDKWQGLATEQRDKDFFTFKEASWGIRAMARVLINYQDDHELNTISKIISRWAPTNENDTSAYINMVAKNTGFDKNQGLDLHTYPHLFPLVKAIIKHENGYQPYEDVVITKGLVLAGVEPDKKPLSESRTIQASQVAATATATGVVVSQLAPAFPLLQSIAQYAPAVLGVLVLAALAYIVYARIADRKAGLR